MTLPVFGPPPPPPAAVRLAEVGYENVRVVETGKSIAVWYESRRFPTQLEGLAEVLAIVAPMATADAELRVVALRFDQPILEVTTTPGEVAEAGSERSPLRARVGRGPAPPFEPLNSSNGHSDVTLQPAYRFDQATYAILARAHFESPLTSGTSLVGRLQAPFLPTLGFDQPMVAFRSAGWMAPDFPAVFQVGYDRGKPHLAGEVAYQAFGGLGFLKVKAGLIQDALPEFVAKAEARAPAWDLTLGGGWAHWPIGDWGPFFTVRRTFPRSLFEVGAYRTHFGTQFRATFGIDLGPNPRPAPGAIRFLPIGYWQTSYLATAYAAADGLEPDPDVDQFLDRLTPAYVEAHLDRLPWPAGSLQAPPATGSPGQTAH